MTYQIRVAGKIFKGERVRTLLKRAVEARQRERETQRLASVNGCPNHLLEVTPLKAGQGIHSR